MIRESICRWLAIPSVRGIRGAITVDANCSESIAGAVAELILEIEAANGIGAVNLVSAVFTMTPDLTAAFPATAARCAGWDTVPLLCATEIAVPGALPRCLRILVHAERCWHRPPRAVYLRGAVGLRPDLASGEAKLRDEQQDVSGEKGSSPSRRSPFTATALRLQQRPTSRPSSK